jgi:hypothetical protein
MIKSLLVRAAGAGRAVSPMVATKRHTVNEIRGSVSTIVMSKQRSSVRFADREEEESVCSLSVLAV